MWDELRAGAAEGRFPKGIDVFRHKFFGLFYVAPAQDSFMCRLRIPNGVLQPHQMIGLAAVLVGYIKGETLLEAALAKAGITVDAATLEKARLDQAKRDDMAGITKPSLPLKAVPAKS